MRTEACAHPFPGARMRVAKQGAIVGAMSAEPPRPIPFDVDYARAQIQSLGFADACAKVAACWLAASTANRIPTLAAFDAAGGARFRDDTVVFEFDRSEVRFVAVGDGFQRVLGDEPAPGTLREFGNPAAYAERLRKTNLAIAGHAIRNLRQLHLNDGETRTAEELILPLADRGPQGAFRCLFFADFGDLPLSARFRRDDFDEPQFSAAADLFARPESR